MNKIVFSKYEGLGNDFIVIDESQDNGDRREPSTSNSLRRALCDRKLGIGGDGVITLLPPVKDDSLIFMHITNADGSVPENCGNGLRCVAQWLKDNGKIANRQVFYIDTYSGSKKAVIDDGLITVELGLAKVNLSVNDPQLIEKAKFFAQVHHVAEPRPIAFVDLGNPHLIVETPDIELAQLELGPELEKLAIFSRGVNVSFVDPKDPSTIFLRVWERGSGATDACGSGSGASVSAYLSSKKLQEGIPIAAYFKKGKLSVLAQRRSDSEFDVELRGSAQRIFHGEWDRFELS